MNGVQGGVEFVDLELPTADLRRLKKHRSVENKGGKCDKKLLEKLTQANATLTLSALPESLPCRDEEKKHIRRVLEDFFEQKTGRSLYICGVPGTGKTATTLEVVSQYKQRQDTEFVLINCLSMATVSDLYAALLNGLIGRHSGKQSAFGQLSQYFKESEKLSVVILDEMDVLLTKKSAELYNLFEWCWEGGRLCIIGISNTVDLPKRLPAPIQRRMGTDALTFKPYTKQQMESIIADRLGSIDVFHDVAIQRAAAKVSHANGDVRRALQLLQLSIDVFKRPTSDSTPKITAHHVGEAISEMFGSEMLSDLSVMEKLLLSSLMFCSRSPQNEDGVSALSVVRRVTDVARMCDHPIPHDAVILRSLKELHVVGIVRIDDIHRRQRRLFDRVSLNVSESDLTKILAQDQRLERITTALTL